MAVKNAVAKTWTNTAATGPITPDPVNGRRYSIYPNGDRPGTYPVIYWTDFPDGPTTGGENNKGCTITIIGQNFGSNFAAWGVTNHVYIGGVEVDNYRSLGKAVGSGSGTKGVYERWGLQALRVQVGALGTPVVGTALKITMTVNGIGLGNLQDGSSNFLDFMDGSPLTFTPVNTGMFFVDPVNGNDANTGLWGSPKKTLQGSTGFTGALFSATGSNQTNGCKPGHYQIINPSGATIATRGNAGFWANLFRISGANIGTGANQGGLWVTSYPGAAGANAPQTVKWAPANGGGLGGGFIGNDRARGANSLIGVGTTPEVNPYDGANGWGRRIGFSCIAVFPPSDSGRDGCPFNADADADGWRVINCEASWLSTTTGSDGAKAGCFSGDGNGMKVVGNYFHDMSNGDGQNQNHFVYLDGANVCAQNCIVAWNYCENNSGGNGLQVFNGQAPTTYFTNIFLHNNFVKNVNKHGITLSNGIRTAVAWNNVIVESGEAACNFTVPDLIAANAVSVENNTFVDWGVVAPSRVAIWNQGGTGSGSVDFRNNIVSQRSTGVATGAFTGLDGTGTNNLSYNRWYDAKSGTTNTTAPDSGSHGTWGDPLFTSASTEDYTLQSGSPCIAAATTDLITRLYDHFGFQLNTPMAQGAYEFGTHL